MALFGVVLLAVPLLGMIGPVELVILMVLAALWLVALLRWAIPGDRRAKQKEPSLS